MVAAFDAYRREKRGPDPSLMRPDNPMIVGDPFKEKPKAPPKPKPWEEPPVLSEDDQAQQTQSKKAADLFTDPLDDGHDGG